MENMIKTNVHPYVYMSKYAMRHFEANKEDHRHKNALIYVSSTAAFIKSTTAIAGLVVESNQI